MRPKKTTNFPVSPQVATLGVAHRVVNSFQREFHQSGQGLAANLRDLFKLYPQAAVSSQILRFDVLPVIGQPFT
jgi:hypothetical protein